MNVLDLLHDDHETVNRLFSDILSTSSADQSRRRQLFGALKEALIKHAHAEEKVFYPPLHEKRQAHDLIEEGIHEHHSMEDLLHKAETVPMDSDDWLDRVQSLKECVEHHVHEEESEVFPKARQLMDGQELDRLGDQIERAKAQEGPIH
ncbi:MAG: hemerythrin domain-containing protein [Solirubrobacterales bacterium]